MVSVTYLVGASGRTGAAGYGKVGIVAHNTRVVVGLTATAAFLFGLALYSGVPVSAVVPPVWTVGGVAAAPLVVVGLSRIVWPDPAYNYGDQRRAEAAFAPRPRRTGGTVGAPTPVRPGMVNISRASLESAGGPTL